MFQKKCMIVLEYSSLKNITSLMPAKFGWLSVFPSKTAKCGGFELTLLSHVIFGDVLTQSFFSF